MSEQIFGLVSSYGLWIVAFSSFFSCLALPIPTALVMLAAGAFAAAGDLVLWQVWLVAWLAALGGDNTGYQLGRQGGVPLVRWLGRRTGKERLIAKGEETVAQYGGMGVFFSTWLVAPLGPWVNLLSGAMGLSRWRFFVFDTAGETIWVTAYVGLGFAFGSQVDTVATMVTDWAGLVAALAVAAGFAVALVVKLWKAHRPATG